MPVAIRQLHPFFFGEVSGVDLRKPLTPQEAADIEAGMDKYAVLLFRGQDISDEQQLVFGRQFGSLTPAHPVSLGMPEHPRNLGTACRGLYQASPPRPNGAQHQAAARL